MSLLRRFDGLRFTARSLPWIPAVAASVIAASVVVARHGRAAAFPLQVVAIVLASGAGFALDDPAFEVLASSATSLLRRRLGRLLVVLPPAVILWTVLLHWQGTAGSQEMWALIAVFAGLSGLSLGVAGVATRRSSGRLGGVAVAPTLLVALILSTTLPPRWRPLPLGDVPGGWLHIDASWAGALIVGVLLFLVSSRDPASRA
jgi:hypothetical protein